MNDQTIKKRDELIAHFGSIKKYQLGIFDKISPVFFLVCDKQGNVSIDHDSVGRYIEKEMKEHMRTIDQLLEGEEQTFRKMIDEYYSELFV